MANKIVGDTVYALTKRTDPDVDEPLYYWLGSDGSTLELSADEARELDISAAPLDFDDSDEPA